MRRVIAGLRTDLQRAIASRDELKGDLGRINAENDRLLKALGEFQHISTTRLVRDWAEKWSPVLQRNRRLLSSPFINAKKGNSTVWCPLPKTFSELYPMTMSKVSWRVCSNLISFYLFYVCWLCPNCLALFWILLLSLIFLPLSIQNRSRWDQTVRFQNRVRNDAWRNYSSFFHFSLSSSSFQARFCKNAQENGQSASSCWYVFCWWYGNNQKARCDQGNAPYDTQWFHRSILFKQAVSSYRIPDYRHARLC